MAAINTPADLEANRVNPHDVYVASDSLFDFSPSGGARALAFRNNSEVYCQRFVTTRTLADVNLGTGTTVRMANTSAGLRDGQIENGTFRGHPNQTQWEAGTLTATNCTFVYDGATAQANSLQEWPGYWGLFRDTNNPTTYTMNIPGCIFMSGVDQQASQTRMVAHFEGINPDGANDFTNVDFRNGQLIIPFNTANWLGITYSPDSAADVFSSAPLTYRRFLSTAIGADFNGFWSGEFACDFRNWTDTAVPAGFTIRSGHVGANTDTQLDWFIIDGRYSDEWRTAGFQATDDSNRTDGGGARVPINLITGRSWNPQFLDFTARTNVTDVQFDIGAGARYYFPQETSDTGTDITITTASTTRGGSDRYISTFLSNGDRRNGIIQVDGTALSSDTATPGAIFNVPVRQDVNAAGAPADTRTYPYWSYTHQCYNNRAILNATGQAATFTAPNVLSTDVATFQTVELEADTFLNNRTSTIARGLVSSGISVTNDVYPVFKIVAYDDKFEDFPVVPSGTVLEFDRSVEWVSTGNTVYGNAVNIRVSGTTFAGTGEYDTIAINPSTGFGNDFSFAGAVTLSDITLRTAGNVNFTNLTLGNNVTIDGATLENTTLDGLTVALRGAVSFATRPAGGTLGWANVDIPDGTTVTIPDGPVIITIAGLSREMQARVRGSNIQFIDPSVTNNFVVPNARAGRYAITFNKSGVESVFTPPTDITTSGPGPTFAVTNAINTGNIRDGFVDGDQIILWIKYDSQIERVGNNAPVVYDHTRVVLTFNGTADGLTQTFTGAATIPETLIESAVAGTGYAVANSSSGEANVALTSTTTPPNSLVLQASATVSAGIAIGNLDNVFDAWYDNRATTTDSPLSYLQGNTIRFNSSALTIESGNRSPYRQHQVSGWAGTGDGLFRTTNGVPDIVNIPANLATIPVEVIAAGVDASSTSARVQNVERGTGYLVGAGNSADTDNATGSKLNGIKPKRNDYNSTTAWEDVL